MSHLVRHITLGAQLQAADFRDFSVAEVRYRPNASLSSHEHDFTYLSLVLRGGFEERVGRQAELAGSASVVVMPAGVTHGECIGPLGARSVTVALKSPFQDQAACVQHHLKQWRWFHGGPVARIMVRAYREHLLADAATELGLCELLFQLIESIGSERNCQVGFPRRCVTAATELLRERGMTGVRLGDLAAELSTDPAYLARTFRRHMGCTMSQYRRRLWVQQAAHLLASTDASLGQVALSSGFADQSHLCRVFKAELGVTPQAYRILAGPR